MTIEKAIDVLTDGNWLHYLDSFCAVREKERSELMASIDVVRAALRAQSQSKWISVKDRLPSDDGKYLVYKTIYGTSHYSVVNYTNCYNGDDAGFIIRKGAKCFYGCDSEYGDYEISGVTHWMPLPQPPKEETK